MFEFTATSFLIYYLLFSYLKMQNIMTKRQATKWLIKYREIHFMAIFRIFTRLLIVLSFVYPAHVWAETPSVGVIYPEVREPYRAVFMEIIRGIEAGLNQSVKHYVLNGEDSSAALLDHVREDHVDVVISLGRAGLSATKQFAEDFPVVIGAVMISPNQEVKGQTGITLAPDPDVLFARLKDIVPDAKEVSVVYDPRQKAWEIDRAIKVAKSYALTLNAFPSEDLHLSAELYRKLLGQIKDGSVAIWLPLDNPAMDEQTLLPVVLQEAWEKNFVVFSGNLDHVRKGALFSLYPDNFGMGRSLATLALERLKKGASTTSTINPLRDLLLAVNLRTAEHLGLRFASHDREQFDLVFPAP